ncbi:hypothetical protein JB92DRAFT_2701365, partial [Gautieria morchelliformis]
YISTALAVYTNWLSKKSKVIAKYGERWYRIWVYFLAYSTIVARQGGSAAFQIMLHKNQNAYHRIEGVKNHASIKVTPKKEIS